MHLQEGNAQAALRRELEQRSAPYALLGRLELGTPAGQPTSRPSSSAGRAAPHAPADGAAFLLKRQGSDPALYMSERPSLVAMPPAGRGAAAVDKRPKEVYVLAHASAVEEALQRRRVRLPASLLRCPHVQLFNVCALRAPRLQHQLCCRCHAWEVQRGWLQCKTGAPTCCCWGTASAGRQRRRGQRRLRAAG